MYNLPITDLRMGHYTAAYFNKEKEILENTLQDPVVTMQVFNRVPGAILCGIKEVLYILKKCTGYFSDDKKAKVQYRLYRETMQDIDKARDIEDYRLLQLHYDTLIFIEEELNSLWVDTHKDLNVMSLRDGHITIPNRGVMEITGRASYFAHLESVYLGILARSTKIANNTKKVAIAANGKHIFFCADRFDRFENQASDGYAAMVGGAITFATNAMGDHLDNISGSGTMPHALIACFNGNLCEAVEQYHYQYPGNVIVALVDFTNDCVTESVKIASYCRRHKIPLWGVRLDTSANMVDKSLFGMMGNFAPTGVTSQLVQNVRKALDVEYLTHVQIMVSGGFTEEKIYKFENEETCPNYVNAYAVGSSLLQGNYDFTADIVMVNGKAMSKVGREYNPHKNLTKVNWDEI